MENQINKWVELLTVNFPDQEKEHLVCFAYLCYHLELAGTFDKGAIIIHDTSTGKDKPLIQFPCLGTIDTFVGLNNTFGYVSKDMDWDGDILPEHTPHILILSTLLSLLEEYGYTEKK